MSMTILQMSATSAAALREQRKERRHRVRVMVASFAAFAFLISIGIYGASYYILPLDQRPYSEKHELLKPSGAIGLKLGVFGTILFFIIFLYALRKVIPWLGRIGTARHWMDFHVIAGVSAPFVIAFHASFKFGGIAGVAFWIMLAVALSGVVGRYLYAQIPRSLTAAELSLSELHENESALAEFLLVQSVFTEEQLRRALRMASPDRASRIGAIGAICQMIMLDIGMPFRMAKLRRIVGGPARGLRSLGGLISTGNLEVEEIIGIVKQKASLSKRVVFLDQTQRVFHLWHVIHRPFSYAFALLAILHIAVVMGLGFAGMGMR
ncbi:hypothetical protein P8935_02405 [Telmatobacter sp. DSM 110680]|uniref:Type II secretion system protein GspF domain-containing protein n=1 Tax=Telmatobacter sp. DSM 110680 TaxID=3036704 RepID=A0AAU7DLN8_9BACT